MKKIFLSFFPFLLLLSLCHAHLRLPRVAGQFYPKDKKMLSTFIDQSMPKKQIKISGRIVSLLVPHAGYEFSGRVAALAYSVIGGDYEVVFLIGPAHRSYIKNAAVYPRGFFQTPLGKIQIDEKVTAELLKSPHFSASEKAHTSEHSLEVQLPFLQKKLKPGFKIVPILINTENIAELQEMAARIAKAARGRKALLIASSDFSHYPAEDIARKADKTMIRAISSFNIGYLMKTAYALMNKNLKNYVTAACGKSAVAVVMEVSRMLGATEFKLLKYSNSFKENPKNASSSSVVGYAVGVFVSGKKAKRKMFKIRLGEEGKRSLLKLARDSIISELKNREMDMSLSDNPEFNLPAAVFVTLEKNGNLRGCIGTTVEHMALKDSVVAYARAAAFSDSRFIPVKLKEMDDIEIEISILSALCKITSYKEIVPGKHGVVVSDGKKSGLFLPQVWEKIKGKEDFLSELCSQKAGLPPDCWKNKGTNLYIFTVDSFKEPR